jgi:outer membrane protein assembly factor BamB
MKFPVHFLGGVAQLLVVAQAMASDWPQYHGPKANRSTDESIQTRWPDGGPRQLWKTPLKAGFSSFAVADGRAYTLVVREVQTVKSEMCIALDAERGNELWAAKLGSAYYDGGGDSGAPGNDGGDGPRSTPAADSNRVYVVSAGLMLFCLNGQNGEVLWKKDLVREFGGKGISWQNAASPLIDGNLLFLCGGGEGQSLLCFHKVTGGLVWKGQSDRMTHSTPVASTILGHRQIIFLTQSGLVSVVPGTGKVLWRYAFPYRTSTAAAPVVGGEIVFCSAGYGVGSAAVLISKDGEQFRATELWKNKLMNHWSSSVYHDGHLYGLFGFKEYQQVPLKCVELATGQEKWSKPGFGQGGLILAGGTLVVLAENGELVAVNADPAGYSEQARCKAVSGKCWNSPALANGRVFARSTKEGVCLDVSKPVSGGTK